MSRFVFLSVLCVLLCVLSVSAQQQMCRIDGYEFPCPRVVESLFFDYRAYGAIEAVAYTGLPVGRPLDILESMFQGEEQLLRYFNGGNRGNETIPHTYPRGIIVDLDRHAYYPVMFLPNAYMGGRAPASTVPSVVAEPVSPLGRVEPITVPMFERPTDARIRDTVLAAHFVLRTHGQMFNNGTFGFFSYDMPTHRGPTYTSEIWVFPPVPATAAATHKKISMNE